MKKSINKDIIPLFISVILILITLFTNYLIGNKFYVGIGLIGISSILYFKNKKLYVYVFIMTLLLGLTNVISVFHISLEFRFGPIKFNPIFLSLLIIFMALNKELLNKMFPEKELDENTTLIKHYEQKFKSKTESELKNIADEKSGYVNEAKIASKNILQNNNII